MQKIKKYRNDFKKRNVKRSFKNKKGIRQESII